MLSVELLMEKPESLSPFKCELENQNDEILINNSPKKSDYREVKKMVCSETFLP